MEKFEKMEELTTSDEKNSPLDFINDFPRLRIRKTINCNIISHIKSYVNRGLKITSGQSRGYQIGMSQYELKFNKDESFSQLCRKIPNIDKYEKIVFDIGFGDGNLLVDMANTNPQNLYIGIETFRPGIGALFVKSLPLALKNIRVFHGDALEIMFYMLEDNSLDMIQIFFPDPWQKNKHHKRRLINTKFLQLCLQLLKPAGVLWIVTDWKEYATHIATHMDNLSISEMSQNTTSEHYFMANPELKEQLEAQRTCTKFESKGLKKGHDIAAFVYQKTKL